MVIQYTIYNIRLSFHIFSWESAVLFTYPIHTFHVSQSSMSTTLSWSLQSSIFKLYLLFSVLFILCILYLLSSLPSVLFTFCPLYLLFFLSYYPFIFCPLHFCLLYLTSLLSSVLCPSVIICLLSLYLLSLLTYFFHLPSLHVVLFNLSPLFSFPPFSSALFIFYRLNLHLSLSSALTLCVLYLLVYESLVLLYC